MYCHRLIKVPVVKGRVGGSTSRHQLLLCFGLLGRGFQKKWKGWLMQNNEEPKKQLSEPHRTEEDTVNLLPSTPSESNAETVTENDQITARPSRKALLIGGLIGLAIVLVGAFLAVSLFGEKSVSAQFSDAYETCGSPAYISVGDNGTSMSLQSEGADSPGANFAEVFCVLAALDIPDYVVDKMDSTRALDGTQTANWNGIDASWTYHPDVGVRVILSQEKK